MKRRKDEKKMWWDDHRVGNMISVYCRSQVVHQRDRMSGVTEEKPAERASSLKRWGEMMGRALSPEHM